MKNKNILIIGGTGSWGKALVNELIQIGAAKICIYARSEIEMVNIKQLYPEPQVVALIGDIRDKHRLMTVTKDIDIIFHLAALKHVPICEKMPTEAILTNIVGTQHVIDCAIANGVKKVIYTSTDKAVTPNCTYGCTKLLGEKLILSANEASKETNFIVFRSGNLLGSTGSVIPAFKQQIEKYNRIHLTDKEMNRFFITIPQAAKSLIEAATRGAGGEIFIPRMSALWIYNIAKYLLEQQGLDESHITVTGIRAGEKIDEYLVTEDETKNIYVVSDTLYVIAKKDTHAWIVNGFVQKYDEFYACSKDVVFDYRKTSDYLSTCVM